MSQPPPPNTSHPPPASAAVVSPHPDRPERGWSAHRLLTSNFKALGTPPQVGNRFLNLLLTSPAYLSRLVDLLTGNGGQLDTTATKDFSLEVDAFGLIQRDPVLGNMLLRFPATLLPLLEDAIVEAQRIIRRRAEADGRGDIAKMVVKGEGGESSSGGLTRIHARLTHLPPHLSCCKPAISALAAADTNRIVQVAGTVTKTSGVCMYESTRSYKCCGESRKGGGWKKKGGDGEDGGGGCGGTTTFCVYADLEQQNNALPPPTVCPGCSPDGTPCRSNKFAIVEGMSVHTDYQEIKIQESGGWGGGVSGSRAGSVPRSLLIKCQHDLVDRCQPGDEIVAVGSLISQWQPITGGMSGDVGVALDAHSIRISNAEDNHGETWDAVASAGGSGKSGAVRDELRREFDELWDSPAAKTHPIAVRNMICRSVCPRLYGMSTIKLALLVTLIGGAGHESTADEVAAAAAGKKSGSGGDDGVEDAPEQFAVAFGSATEEASPTQQQEYGYGHQSQLTSSLTPNPRDKRRSNKSKSVQTRRRDQSHMLLVGDPGTGKSQFLRFAAALCPRSVMTTGTGTTSAGLTCAAVRDGKQGEFTLEAGALVLADKGVCCIDEFGCIRDAERTTIHEAMEQQTLSVAKAGIVCKLNCRATVIAVTNAKGGLYDHSKNMMQNTGIDPPLMSRFDLIFRLIDDSDSIRDENIATFLLNNAIEGFGYEATNTTSHSVEKVWPMDKLRAYIATVKSRLYPAVSHEAAELLERHYQACRANPTPTITVTVRFLESLIRLSQAHARLMYRNTVTLQDTAAAILLMESSAGCLGGIEQNQMRDADEHRLYRDPMSTVFPDDSVADIEFLCDEYVLLERYGMLTYLSNDDQGKVWKHVQKYQQDGGGGGPGHGPGDGSGGGNGAWDGLENSHGRYQPQQAPTINEYVTGKFQQPPPPTQQQQPQSHSAMTQEDHYGREQTQQSSRKRSPHSSTQGSTSQSQMSQSSGYNPEADWARLEQHGRGPSPPPLSSNAPSNHQARQNTTGKENSRNEVGDMWDNINTSSSSTAGAGKKRRRRAD